MDKRPVIIVGGGPVGMVLSMNLAHHGVQSVVINTEPGPRWHPKGSTQNSRTMEHYRRLGVSRQIRRLGLPPDHATDVIYFTRLNDRELWRIPMPSEQEKLRAAAQTDASDQVPEPIFRCNQMHVEAFLFDHIKQHADIEARYGWQCVDWSDDGAGVTVHIEEVSSGRRESLSGAYLVACDGGQSAIRKKLGISYRGELPEEQAFMGGPMVSTYIRAPELYTKVLRTRAWQYYAVNPEIRSNIVTIDGTGEFLFNTRLKSADEQPDDAQIARAFFAMVGEDVHPEFLGHWTWTAGHALVADSFAQGRVLLAGDAVHLFTPVGGFGMNTGIDDAANLGWKLASVIQGWGGPHLLSTYEIERRPIALRNTQAAKILGKGIGNVPIGAAIEEMSPAGDRDRQVAIARLSQFGEEFHCLGIQLGARYDHSPIVLANGDSPPQDDPVHYVPSAVPGGRAPHLWYADRSSLYDHFGRGFTLLKLGDASAASGALKSAARRRGIPLHVLECRETAARQLYETGLALIRPDQHVAWRGNRLPDDCDTLLDQVCGYRL